LTETPSTGGHIGFCQTLNGVRIRTCFRSVKVYTLALWVWHY